MAAHLLVERDAPVRASLHPYAGAEEVEDGQIRVHVCKFVFTANTCASPTLPGPHPLMAPAGGGLQRRPDIHGRVFQADLRDDGGPAALQHVPALPRARGDLGRRPAGAVSLWVHCY